MIYINEVFKLFILYEIKPGYVFIIPYKPINRDTLRS